MDSCKLSQAQAKKKKIRGESQKLDEITGSVRDVSQMVSKSGHSLPFLSAEAKMKLSCQHLSLSLAPTVSLGILSP